MKGALIGMTFGLSPTRLPVAIEVGAGIGSYVPMHLYRVMDGYAPFDGSFEVRTARVGLAWPRRPW